MDVLQQSHSLGALELAGNIGNADPEVVCDGADGDIRGFVVLRGIFNDAADDGGTGRDDVFPGVLHGGKDILKHQACFLTGLTATEPRHAGDVERHEVAVRKGALIRGEGIGKGALQGHHLNGTDNRAVAFIQQAQQGIIGVYVILHLHLIKEPALDLEGALHRHFRVRQMLHFLIAHHMAIRLGHAHVFKGRASLPIAVLQAAETVVHMANGDHHVDGQLIAQVDPYGFQKVDECFHGHILGDAGKHTGHPGIVRSGTAVDLRGEHGDECRQHNLGQDRIQGVVVPFIFLIREIVGQLVQMDGDDGDASFLPRYAKPSRNGADVFFGIVLSPKHMEQTTAALGLLLVD